MLFQATPKRNAATVIRRTVAIIAGFTAGLVRHRGDQMYLDGMRPDELEDLGLRRSDNGGYRFFD
jgi:uncharacterized protein YjiS (DUF1127 family)